jgi:hypothetical protein
VNTMKHALITTTIHVSRNLDAYWEWTNAL